MARNNSIYGFDYNPDVLKSMKKINEEIKEEIATDNPDGKKLTEMQMNYLLKGMMLQTNMYHNYNRHIPW